MTQLGSGAYAVVYECTNKVSKAQPRGALCGPWIDLTRCSTLNSHTQQTGKRAAVKVVDRAKLTVEDDEALKEEVDILRHMKHNHIVHLYDFYTVGR